MRSEYNASSAGGVSQRSVRNQSISGRPDEWFCIPTHLICTGASRRAQAVIRAASPWPPRSIRMSMPSSRARRASASSSSLPTFSHDRATAWNRIAIGSLNSARVPDRQMIRNAAGSRCSNPATVSQPTGCVRNEPDSNPMVSARSWPGVLISAGNDPRGSMAVQSHAARNSAAPVTPS